jgi:hypothetical protein
MIHGLHLSYLPERPPQCRSLDHLADAANMIDRRPLVVHHMYGGSDEERGITETQC